MTHPTPVSLPVWESMVADYGDPLLHLDAPPRRQSGLPPVPTRSALPPAPPTAPLPLPGRGATALSRLEAS